MFRGSSHLRSLTSLRFFGAFSVMVYHTAIQSSADLIQPFAVLRFGFLGVSFFFILSGFVLAWAAREGDGAVEFYRRRFARVWPLHALTLGLAVALDAASLIDQHVGPTWSAPLNVGLLQAWTRDSNVTYGYNGVSWSLSDEAFFYALFPLLYLAVRKVTPALTLSLGCGWLVLGGVLAEITGDGWWAGPLPAYRIGEFVIGMGLATWLRRGAPRVSPALAVAVLGGLYASAVVLNRLSGGDLSYRQWLVALIVLPGLAMVLVAFAGRDLRGDEGWLMNPVFVTLGQWSFALYMVHELVLRTARPMMLEHVWTIPLVMVSAIATAGLTYRWIERPVESRLRGQSRPAVQLEPSER